MARKPWLAALLNLLLAPLGHVYAGAPLAGLVWALMILAVPAGIALLRWNFVFEGAVAALILPLLMWLIMAVRAARLAGLRRNQRPSWYQHWVSLLVLAALIGFGLFQLARAVPMLARDVLGFTLVHTTDDSMQPVLAPGDLVLVDTAAYRSEEPGRGELVVYEAEDGSLGLLRAIGRPGERVRLRIDSLVIDSQSAEDPFARWDLEVPEGAGFSGDGEWQLGRDQFVLLGDHRLLARDSRSFGPVPASRIRGRAQIMLRGAAGTWVPLSGSPPGPLLRLPWQP